MYTTVLHDPRLVESTKVEPQIQRTNRKVLLRFSTAQRTGAPTPVLSKGQLHTAKHYTDGKISTTKYRDISNQQIKMFRKYKVLRGYKGLDHLKKYLKRECLIY